MAQLKLSKKSGAAGVVCSVATIIAIVINAGHVRTNERGLELIGNAESCRRDPYLCPAGVLTDGMGNTHGVKPGTIKNDQQIAAEWEKIFSMLNPALTDTPTAEIFLMILSAQLYRSHSAPGAEICGARQCSPYSEKVT